MAKLLARRLTSAEAACVVNEKLEWILSMIRPMEIILFGSAARGEMSEASDVDLLLIFSDRSDLLEARRSLFRAQRTSTWPHDILFMTKAEFEKSVSKGGGACWLAAREGILLFRSSH